ncbi:ABC-F family ATP-binding cassette domain-containing protein [Paenibacillus cellulositrophicus]|uniref:ABC-F family ATP-binding cassette domain-containing protein n=1 Tax=Paenibacillus cellulositrophicus TaxID=562959 RepID=UPI00204003FE|nr:ABC-F family ATP-binding cassette domain-containing protein [Paenibacillus cellulositrophicus]MCM2995998.1 ABC-F family ATP-binding cassette domain-containing protein [Paenibacillus cellulositrophicus]
MLLQASGIRKLFGITPVLEGINLQVQERERIGLVGVNGAGKSTLLQILAGEMSYDGGQIYKSKETTIGYLAQNSGLQSDRTIWEEMLDVFTPLIETEKELRVMEQQIADPAVMDNPKKYQDLLDRYASRSDWFKDHGGYEMETRIRSVLHGMGFGSFAPDTPIATLSGGQKTRLALARILLQAPDLLMLDEPTNHLDIATLTWLEDYLRAYSGSLLVVSHDRYFLDRLVTTIVEIERHQSKRYTGNYSRYMELKAAEYESQMKMYEKQQDEIAKMEAFIQRNIVRASTTKRAQSRRKALEKMDRMDKPLGDLKKAHFSFEVEYMSGKEVLQVRDLSVSFQPPKALFKDVSFDLRRGETVALIGPNGIGKSTLLKCLIGTSQPQTGAIHWGTKVKIGYYDQEQTNLNPSNTVLEELWSAYPHMEEARIRTVLGNFLFSGEDVLKKIAALSGGEKARVSLAKLMLLEANMLILDEPTNHLDLFSKEVLESALIDYEGTLLFISHDRYFLNKMAERIIELHPEGTEHYLGNYDDYVAKKQELEELSQEALEQAGGAGAKNSPSKPEAANDNNDKSGVSSFEADKQAKREERNRQRRLAALEEQIQSLEEEISELDAEMAKPEVYQDYVALQEHQQQQEEKKNQLETIYAEWETLAAE